MLGTEPAFFFSLRLADGKVQVNFGPRWLDDAVRVETVRQLLPDKWHHVAVTHNGSQMASGFEVYVDGKPQQLAVSLDLFTGTFTTPTTLRIGSQGPDMHFRGLIDDVRGENRSGRPGALRH